jgi:hypothetical protein
MKKKKYSGKKREEKKYSEKKRKEKAVKATHIHFEIRCDGVCYIYV